MSDRGLAVVWLERGTCANESKVGVPAAVPTRRTKEVLMQVIIGVDPHKASHTAVAIGDD